jgi:hypothetical protein
MSSESVIAEPTNAPSEVVPAAPLINALAFASESIMPGGSNLLKGDFRQALIHGAGGLVARSLLGLPGMLLVASNSFVKATTGQHLHEHLGVPKRAGTK